MRKCYLSPRPFKPSTFELRARQVTRSVDERQDLNLGRRHLVKQAVALNENLAHIRLLEFWNDATSLAEGVKRRRGIESLDQQALSSGTRVLGDVGDGIIEHLAGLLGPDYASTARSHFRRMACSTSSWGMVRPAATSA